jgi:hypothetical protein
MPKEIAYAPSVARLLRDIDVVKGRLAEELAGYLASADVEHLSLELGWIADDLERFASDARDLAEEMNHEG